MAQATADVGELTALLRQGAERLGISVNAQQQRQFLLFTEQMMKWNAVYNLTAVRDPRQALVTHILDCMSVAPTIERIGAQRLLDVGSGAGLPGIPLAILFPSLQVASVDAVQKKIAFQLHVKGLLKLDSFTPIHARVEALTPPHRYDRVISRAYTDLRTMILEAGPQLTDDGVLIAMKGEIPTPEFTALPSHWQVRSSEVLRVPFLDAQRCVVLIERAREDRATQNG